MQAILKKNHTSVIFKLKKPGAKNTVSETFFTILKNSVT